MARKDGQINFAMLSIGERFKSVGTGKEYVKVSKREAADNEGRKCIWAANSIVERLS